MPVGTRRNFLQVAGSAAGLAAGFLALRVPAQAAAAACGNEGPIVRVDANLPDPVLDNSQPQRAIQALAPAYHGGRTIGLYYSQMETNIRIQFRSVSLRRERASPACLFITAVDVDVLMPSRRIYVARELRPGSCTHTAVLEHERKHEATDDHALRKHVPRIQQAIRGAIVDAGALEAFLDERDAAQARLAKVVQLAFDKAWQAFVAERNDLQLQVDAGLEYARVAASCSDWSELPR